jgi:hypothetical protein
MGEGTVSGVGRSDGSGMGGSSASMKGPTAGVYAGFGVGQSGNGSGSLGSCLSQSVGLANDPFRGSYDYASGSGVGTAENFAVVLDKDDDEPEQKYNPFPIYGEPLYGPNRP